MKLRRTLLDILTVQGASRPVRSAITITLGVAAAATVALIALKPPELPVREALRSELVLRDGRLYRHEIQEPFTGTLIEDYAPGRRKFAIEIRDGKADGVSRGWFDNGQQEVEEHFVEGMSDGLRTRWFENGTRKSVEHIEHGKLVGQYEEWHDNGQRAVSMPLADGKPHGIVEAWHRSGMLKSRSRMEHGKPVEREFFDDSLASATPINR